jgi:hypothetical protein
MATKNTRKNAKHPIIAEFHFSPMEHAFFHEMQEEAEIEHLLDRVFGIDVPNPAFAR